ncbi:ribose-5-phosphate isomerase RpiA [Chitinophaga arvensicola]|uniref:Ribose 5-phosphate isomerase A n=1 Tax=Chitinophaga arvensicola TaxID=29529 RepID=A0A1I0SBG1_9BACT|nr:ribose-5-phosphate isomerase RpiA [Chitinophaga arvensicola]SEW54031.1 ribose-5-phosphate isomerase [Chitinophaga arvensicola]
MEDLKQVAAKAALDFIKPGQTIGLGAGSTIAHLVNYLKETDNLFHSITTVTSSFNTQLLLQEHGFNSKQIGEVSKLDIYFDGCDQFDHQLNALKSGGGIHTREKLLAAMADKFILIGDGSKYVAQLYTTFPVVIEVIPEAVPFVMKQLKKVFSPANPVIRLSNKKDGAVITENGNLLIDIWFRSFPLLDSLNHRLKEIPGVLETSLFYNMAHAAIIAGKKGVEIIPKDPAYLI